MPQRDKWALAFDVGGLRYGVMTTNCSESFNKVLRVSMQSPCQVLWSSHLGSAMDTLSINRT
jgi:hypothetical protein